MSQDQAVPGGATRGAAKRVSERASFYVWTALVLAIAVAAVVLGWHAQGRHDRPDGAARRGIA